jgi:hypothetical protein
MIERIFTMTTSLTTSKNKTRVVAPLVAPETKKFMQLGHQHGWEWFVLGQAPCPSQPVRVGEWLIVPIQHDTSQIPARALERVRAIYEAGLRPKSFVVVHEAPLQLAAPKEKIDNKTTSPQFFSELTSLLVTGAVGSVALGVAILAITAALAIPAALLVSAALLDPILIAVTEDDTWIEIDRWYVE